ncbi:MAG TPA: glycosyltransferase family 1 protein, partial [Thiolapillus brandeum]|nr:glycosyltransferase family 1 protein [Thiolapillus brandeum]
MAGEFGVMAHNQVRIVSPVVRGSGAIIVHRALADAVPGYELVPYDPRWEYFPVFLPLLSRRDAELVHCTPEYAAFAALGDKPLIVTFHNYVLGAFMRPYSTFVQRLHYRTDLLWAYRRSVKRASALVAVSEFTAGLVRQYLSPGLPVQVIRNGVDANLFRPGRTASSRRHIRVLF